MRSALAISPKRGPGPGHVEGDAAVLSVELVKSCIHASTAVYPYTYYVCGTLWVCVFCVRMP